MQTVTIVEYQVATLATSDLNRSGVAGVENRVALNVLSSM
jgi:hypothetical protein